MLAIDIPIALLAGQALAESGRNMLKGNDPNRHYFMKTSVILFAVFFITPVPFYFFLGWPAWEVNFLWRWQDNIHDSPIKAAVSFAVFLLTVGPTYIGFLVGKYWIRKGKDILVRIGYILMAVLVGVIVYLTRDITFNIASTYDKFQAKEFLAAEDIGDRFALGMLPGKELEIATLLAAEDLLRVGMEAGTIAAHGVGQQQFSIQAGGVGDVRGKLAEIIQTSELGYAAGYTASAMGKPEVYIPGMGFIPYGPGNYIPNSIYCNVGRCLTGEAVFREAEILCDISGGVVATFPYEEDFVNPETRDLLLKYTCRNPEKSPEETAQFWRFLGDILCISPIGNPVVNMSVNLVNIIII